MTPERKPLTGPDREKMIEAWRIAQGRKVRRVLKSTFGKNDILGMDVLSYSPLDFYLDQVTTVRHISDRKKKIVEILEEPPKFLIIGVFVHGIDGYRIGKEKIMERWVMEEWLYDGTWERTEIPPVDFYSGGRSPTKDQEGIITPKGKKKSKRKVNH